jgi:hypothetical protein
MRVGRDFCYPPEGQTRMILNPVAFLAGEGMFDILDRNDACFGYL